MILIVFVIIFTSVFFLSIKVADLKPVSLSSIVALLR